MAIQIVNIDGVTYPIYDNRISSLPISVAQGGTGATTAAGAVQNLLGTVSSSAGKYLRDDGTWQTVSTSDTKVNQTAVTTSGGYPILFSETSATKAQWVDGAKESKVDPCIAINPSNSRIVIRGDSYSTTSGDGMGYDLYNTAGGKIVAALQAGTQGTASTDGLSFLTLGNDTASGSAGNAAGKLYIYSTGTRYSAIAVTTPFGDTNRQYYLPDVPSGDFLMCKGSQTIDGVKTFGATTYFGATAYFAGGTTYSVSSTGTGTFNSLEAKGNLYADQKIIGKAGTVSTGNYTTTAASSLGAGTTGQIMFVLA